MRPTLLALFALAALAGCRPSAPEGGGFHLNDVVDHDQFAASLDSTGARAVVVNVWATWCGPCVAEFPELVRYDRTMNGHGVEVRFLSVDNPDDRAQVVQFLQEHSWDEAAYLAADNSIVDALARDGGSTWDGSIPLTFIIADGKVRDGWIGAKTYDVIAGRVDRVLADVRPSDETASL